MSCGRWEKLMAAAERGGNKGKALEFMEKLVECFAYGVQSLVAAGELDEAEELIKAGLEAAKKHGIEELKFHMELNQRRIKEIRERRAAARA